MNELIKDHVEHGEDKALTGRRTVPSLRQTPMFLCSPRKFLPQGQLGLVSVSGRFPLDGCIVSKDAGNKGEGAHYRLRAQVVRCPPSGITLKCPGDERHRHCRHQTGLDAGRAIYKRTGASERCDGTYMIAAAPVYWLCAGPKKARMRLAIQKMRPTVFSRWDGERGDLVTYRLGRLPSSWWP